MGVTIVIKPISVDEILQMVDEKYAALLCNGKVTFQWFEKDIFERFIEKYGKKLHKLQARVEVQYLDEISSYDFDEVYAAAHKIGLDFFKYSHP
jgi:hypothetical protein